MQPTHPLRVISARRFSALLLLLSFPALLSAQSLAGVRLGASPVTIESLPYTPVAREGRGAIKVSKFKLEDGNDLSVTFNSKVNRIVFVELDWNTSSQASQTGVPGLVFGRTTLAEIRRRHGSNGFTWKSVGMQRDGDRVLAFNAYEIRDKPGGVVVYVTAVKIAEFQVVGRRR
jgi:hypothetical protein